MGAIIPFIARVRDSGDWTAAERAKLDSLADYFAAMGITVDVVYGVSDDGDPWCVVKGDDEEILLHVARIGDRFVVHSAIDDTLGEATDLPSALGERLMVLDEPDDDHVVIPFAVGGRQAQLLIALVAATAFFYETREAHAAPEPQQPPEPAPEDQAVLALSALGLEDAVRVERATATHSPALGEADVRPATAWSRWVEPAAPEIRAQAAEAQPLPPLAADDVREAAQAAPAPLLVTQIVGTDGDDVLVGSAQTELIQGGDGADTLAGGGAALGQYDTLDGGAGDDRIEVTAQVVAIGGAGADAFVIQAPAQFGDPTVFLGFIADFRVADGDHLEGAHGRPVTLTPPPDGDARFQPPDPAPDVMTGQVTTNLFVDLNGDGHADGYLVVGAGPVPLPRPAAPAEPPEAHEEPTVSGLPLPGLGLPLPEIG